MYFMCNVLMSDFMLSCPFLASQRPFSTTVANKVLFYSILFPYIPVPLFSTKYLPYNKNKSKWYMCCTINHVPVINEGFCLKLLFLDKNQAFVIHLQRSTLSQRKPLFCTAGRGLSTFLFLKSWTQTYAGKQASRQTSWVARMNSQLCVFA